MNIYKENIANLIYQDSETASIAVAEQIVALIKQKEKEGKPCVLGLATGSTPTRVYAELVAMYQSQKVSFKNVITFNLDEYFPMQPQSLQSYVRFMHEHLFDHIDILPENIHIPDGSCAKEET